MGENKTDKKVQGEEGGALEEYFEADPEFDWKPIEVVKDWSNVVTMADGGEQANMGPW